MKLAEIDAKIRIVSQERLHVELLEDQLENLQTKLSQWGGILENLHDIIPKMTLVSRLVKLLQRLLDYYHQGLVQAF